MTLKFVIILQNLIKAYHRKSGKSKYDRKLTKLDVETTRIRSRANGALIIHIKAVASSIIGGEADIHIYVFTHHKNNRFQRKLIVKNTNI